MTNPTPTPTPTPHVYRWWPAESVAQLLAQLQANPGAILKQYADDPGYLHVHPISGGALADDCPPPINDSRTCPPICP